MARREFKASIKVAIIHRATRGGVVYCEGCGLPTKQWAIDHIKPDALEIDKSRALTAADGQLLCAGSRLTCHGRKTAEEDVPAIRRAQRREAAHLGIRKESTLHSANTLRRGPREPKRLDPAKRCALPTALERQMTKGDG